MEHLMRCGSLPYFPRFCDPAVFCASPLPRVTIHSIFADSTTFPPYLTFSCVPLLPLHCQRNMEKEVTDAMSAKQADESKLVASMSAVQISTQNKATSRSYEPSSESSLTYEIFLAY